MVVVSLFGIAASLVTASYLTFERNQRLRSAALSLKNDLRLVQNKATSGDKGPGGDCPALSILGGWYLYTNSTAGVNTSYKFGGDCVTLAAETVFLEKTVNLPPDTKINRIFYTAGDLNQPTAIFFRPLKSGVSFHNGVFAPPDFFEADGVTLRNKFPEAQLPPTSWVTIEIANAAASRFYWVRIETTGEINEIKP
ncbi:hypothetical protein HYZ70_02820 [Candidatus Curtissbacteria bacterium]|nr:hypothetical protein [Candidatus Curtissbacteria bacterium]